MNRKLYTKNELMQIAINEAKKGIINNEGGPFGSVIAKMIDDNNGYLIAKGHNQVVKNNDPTCHGEMMAIHKACKKLNSFNLSGYTLFTTGVPCPMCFGAILWANIDKVYYGCDLKDTEQIGFKDEIFMQKIKNSAKYEDNFIQLDRNQCLKLYNYYLSLKNKTPY